MLRVLIVPDRTELAALGPIEHVCSVSVKEKGSWELGDSTLGTFKEIPAPFDLTTAIDALLSNQEDWSWFLEPYVHLDILLESCVQAGRVDAVRKADVIVWRGVLRQ